MIEQVLHVNNDKLSSPKSLLIKHKKLTSQSNKFSALMKPFNNNHSLYMTKNHSISSPNLKHYLNPGEKHISQTCPLTVVKKLDEIVNKKQRDFDNKSKERQQRQQVYRFFNEQRDKIINKQRQMGYLLPKIRVGHKKSSNQSPKIETLEKQNNSKEKSSHQFNKQHKQLSPQMLSYRKRCQIQLEKIKLTLPKFLEKKEKFFDLSDDIVKDLTSIKDQEIDNISRVNKNEQMRTQNKFYLVKNTQSNHSILKSEQKDSTVPQFLMERLSVGSSPQLRKFSFFTEIDQRNLQPINSPKRYTKELFKKDKIKKQIR